MEAFRWYEKQSKGLGSAFLLSVDAAISSLQRDPELYPQIFKTVRRALLRRFPYGVHYVANQENIIILDVFHAKRNPEQLKKRK